MKLNERAKRAYCRPVAMGWKGWQIPSRDNFATHEAQAWLQAWPSTTVSSHCFEINEAIVVISRKIILVENGEILSHDKRISECLN